MYIQCMYIYIHNYIYIYTREVELPEIPEMMIQYIHIYIYVRLQCQSYEKQHLTKATDMAAIYIESIYMFATNLG